MTVIGRSALRVFLPNQQGTLDRLTCTSCQVPHEKATPVSKLPYTLKVKGVAVVSAVEVCRRVGREQVVLVRLANRCRPRLP